MAGWKDAKTRTTMVDRIHYQQQLANRLRQAAVRSTRTSVGDLRQLLTEAADSLEREADPDAAETFELSDPAGLLIIRATNQMPYAGAMAASLREPVTAGGIDQWMRELAGRLRQHADEAERDRRDLAELRDQQRAIRRFLGTDTPEAPRD